MRLTHSARLIALVATAALFTACGGGGGGGSDGSEAASPAPGPITGTTTTVGAITGFGSVHVNGVHYRTGNDTEIMVYGERADEGSLKVGQIVTLTGTVDSDGENGHAISIDMQEAVRGPITSIDTGAGSFVALGQTVLVTADTLFDAAIDPADLSALGVDDIVEVSGFRDADGAIVASFIELADPARHYEVVGTVSALDADAKTFVIGNLVIDFSGAQLSDFEAGALADGDVVEAEGTTFSDTDAFIADRIKRETMHGDYWHHSEHHGDADRACLEGLITRFDSPTDFDVAGQPVTTTDTTRFEHGTVANLALDLHVEVKGTVDENGVLVATEVELYGISTVKIGGIVDEVSTNDNSLTVLGIPVQVDLSTRYRDDSSAELRTFGIADVTVGDYVEIAGYIVDVDTSQVLAAKLRREDQDSAMSVELAGPVSSFDAAAGSLVVLGVTVTTDGATSFVDAARQSIDATAFFGALVGGDAVKVRGTATSVTPPASLLATSIKMGGDYSHHHDDH
jgi:hypothetical protein